MVKKNIPVQAVLRIPVLKYGSEVGKKVDPAPVLEKKSDPEYFAIFPLVPDLTTI